MAYRRRQGMTRSFTFKEEIQHPSFDHQNNLNLHPASPDVSPHPSSSATALSVSSPPSSLAAQAIRFSSPRRDSSLSSSFANRDSAFSTNRHGSKVSDQAYEEGSDSAESPSNSGFWGVIARKAKAILEDDGAFQPKHMLDNTGMGGQENRVVVENKAADIKLQMKRKGGNYEDSNQAPTGLNNSLLQPTLQQLNPTKHETQLKASRDVAMATAAKAKLLLRELKTVKADLAFAKQRCSQLEEENKILREGREKGHTGADDDLIRLQLETLLAEKARLAHENEICARENRFLREIVEYHQLSMEDVVYLDDNTEEETEFYPLSGDEVSRIISRPTTPSPSPLELETENPSVAKLKQVLEMDCSSNVSSDPKEDGAEGQLLHPLPKNI